MRTARDINIEIMKERLKVPYIICSQCGNKENLAYIDPVRGNLIDKMLCFSCNFWSEYVSNRNYPNSVRVNGNHYWILSETIQKGAFRGHSGIKFRIDFFDGRIVYTTNLWHQGVIPERFRDVLEDNTTLDKED